MPLPVALLVHARARSAGSDEFVRVVGLLHETFAGAQVQNVERIERRVLWHEYAQRKQRLERKLQDWPLPGGLARDTFLCTESCLAVRLRLWSGSTGDRRRTRGSGGVARNWV